MLLIDKYSYNNNLRNVSPRAKFILAFGFLIIATWSDSSLVHAAIFLLNVIIIIFLAKIPFKNFLKILGIPLGFLVLSIITIVITFGNQEYLLQMHIGKLQLGITSQSLSQGVTLFFRSFASLSSMIFLTLTTPMIDLIKVLKKFRVPDFFIELMVLIYRLIFIFLEECMEIRNAQEIRFGYSTMKNSFKSLSVLIKIIFIRVLQRNKEMLISLECKLYDGEFPFE